jgi:hypothetical protein
MKQSTEGAQSGHATHAAALVQMSKKLTPGGVAVSNNSLITNLLRYRLFSVFGGFTAQGQSITQGFEDVPTMLSTVAPFSQTSVVTLDGAPITVSQVDIVGTREQCDDHQLDNQQDDGGGHRDRPLDERHAR